MSTTIREQTVGIATEKSNGALNGMATGVYTLWLKHMRKFWSSSMEIGGTLAMPILWMLLFGVSMQTLVPSSVTGTRIGYEAFITPGVMLLTSLSAAILGGTTLLTERVNGIVKEYMVAPIPRLAILLGTMASSLTKALLQSLVVLLLGLLLEPALIFNLTSLVIGLGVVIIYSLGFVGIAAAVASKAKSMESYHSLIMILNLPVLFLSNALYPLEAMPLTIKVLAYLNPTTYAIDAIRYLFYGAKLEIGLWIDLPVLLIFMVGAIWYGYRNFQRMISNPAS
jgi:ABC-2 type transport system permease protein